MVSEIKKKKTSTSIIANRRGGCWVWVIFFFTERETHKSPGSASRQSTNNEREQFTYNKVTGTENFFWNILTNKEKQWGGEEGNTKQFFFFFSDPRFFFFYMSKKKTFKLPKTKNTSHNSKHVYLPYINYVCGFFISSPSSFSRILNKQHHTTKKRG